jgi:hypothetical protein
MEIFVKREVDPQKWDDQLKMSKYGTVFQSAVFAQCWSKARGEKPLFVNLASDGNELAMAVIFKSSQLLSSRAYSPLTSPLFSLLSIVKPYYWSLYGPILLVEGRETQDALLKYLRYLLFRRGTRTVFMAHPLCDNPDPYQRQGFSAKQLMTCIIDLKQDLETLKQNMDKKSALKNAMRSLERGVQVYEASSSEDFDVYCELLKQARKRLDIRPYNRRELSPFVKMMREGIMKCFIAAKGERPLAGLLISTFNGYLNEWGAAQALEDITEHLYGNDLLRYHIIEWGHNAGHGYYDQSGISTSSSTKEQGIFRFKTKWGGKIVCYNEYTIGRRGRP